MGDVFKVQLVLDPRSQLGALAVVVRNITVPVDFVVFGKLAQTFFPGGAVAVTFHAKGYGTATSAMTFLFSAACIEIFALGPTSRAWSSLCTP
jgi:hypothetical protein